MKLHLINDDAAEEQQRIQANERKALIKQLRYLSKKINKAATTELAGLIADPGGLASHITRGLSSTHYIVDDGDWWTTMFNFWIKPEIRIDPKILYQYAQDIALQAENKIQDAVEAGIVVEDDSKGDRSKGGGFLGFLAYFAMLFMMLVFPDLRKEVDKEISNRGRRGSRRGKSDNLGITHPDRDDLPPTPSSMGADNTFKKAQLNGFIINSFVARCINAVEQAIQAGTIEPLDASGPDLADERPLADNDDEVFNSGEEVEYPRIHQQDDAPITASDIDQV